MCQYEPLWVEIEVPALLLHSPPHQFFPDAPNQHETTPTSLKSPNIDTVCSAHTALGAWLASSPLHFCHSHHLFFTPLLPHVSLPSHNHTHSPPHCQPHVNLCQHITTHGSKHKDHRTTPKIDWCAHSTQLCLQQTVPTVSTPSLPLVPPQCHPPSPLATPPHHPGTCCGWCA